MQMDERDIEDLTVSKFAVGLLPRGQITSSPILIILYITPIFSARTANLTKAPTRDSISVLST